MSGFLDHHERTLAPDPLVMLAALCGTHPGMVDALCRVDQHVWEYYTQLIRNNTFLYNPLNWNNVTLTDIRDRYRPPNIPSSIPDLFTTLTDLDEAFRRAYQIVYAYWVNTLITTPDYDPDLHTLNETLAELGEREYSRNIMDALAHRLLWNALRYRPFPHYGPASSSVQAHDMVRFQATKVVCENPQLAHDPQVDVILDHTCHVITTMIYDDIVSGRYLVYWGESGHTDCGEALLVWLIGNYAGYYAEMWASSQTPPSTPAQLYVANLLFTKAYPHTAQEFVTTPYWRKVWNTIVHHGWFTRTGDHNSDDNIYPMILTPLQDYHEDTTPGDAPSHNDTTPHEMGGVHSRDCDDASLWHTLDVNTDHNSVDEHTGGVHCGDPQRFGVQPSCHGGEDDTGESLGVSGGC